jgi:hypothetical protein
LIFSAVLPTWLNPTITKLIGYAKPWIVSPREKATVYLNPTLHAKADDIQGIKYGRTILFSPHTLDPRPQQLSRPPSRRGANPGSYALVKGWQEISVGSGLEVQFYL